MGRGEAGLFSPGANRGGGGAGGPSLASPFRRPRPRKERRKLTDDVRSPPPWDALLASAGGSFRLLRDRRGVSQGGLAPRWPGVGGAGSPTRSSSPSPSSSFS